MSVKRSVVYVLTGAMAIALAEQLPLLWRHQARAAEATGASQPTAITDGTDWTASIEPNSVIRIYHKGSLVLNTQNLFWGPQWQFTGPNFKRTSGPGQQYAIIGDVPGLKLKLNGKIAFPKPNTIELAYVFTAGQETPGAIGGGWQWDFKLDSPTFHGRLPDPELLADQTGWTWKTGPDQAISLRFEGAPGKVFYEANNKNTVRTFFFSGGVPAGSHVFRVTLELPEGASRVVANDERYGPPDTSKWFKNALSWDTSPVDLSFLNRDDRPAGRHGLVKAEGDHFIFEDGTPARFWGANLAAGSLFLTPRQTVAKQAHRMAQLGYNLMRIHHHDSGWVKPNIIDPKYSDSRHLDLKSLDLLDWWIKCLKDEGIYVWIDAHVGREMKPDDPVKVGAAEIRKGGGNIKGFCYYNQDLQKLMIEFQHNYLNHTNRYTKLAYKDDPAVMGVLITNENDLTSHQGFAVLPDKGNPAHNALFNRAYKAFARETGLAENRVLQIWLSGPGTIYSCDFEHRFNQTMIEDLRSLGVRAPIATTNYWGNESLAALPSLTDGDVIDVHSYGSSEALSANPRYDANYISWIAAAQISGKPLTITEWNVNSPQVDRFTAPLYLASIAALQGWDAPMIYNYSQSPLNNPGRPDIWSTFFDPALTGVMPAAALAYRQGHVSPAKKTYCLMLDETQLFDRSVDPRRSSTIRTLSELSRLTIGMPSVKELPWLKPTEPPSDATVLTDLNRDFIPEGQSFIRSDTGELLRNWKYGIQTIDTPKTQAVSGWIEGKTLKTQDASFLFSNKKATVALSSLDNQPLNSSRSIMITALARTSPSAGNRMPMLTEPVTGSISLRTKTSGLQLQALHSDGRVVERSTPIQDHDTLTIRLPSSRGTHWYLLKSTQAPEVEE